MLGVVFSLCVILGVSYVGVDFTVRQSSAIVSVPELTRATNTLYKFMVKEVLFFAN